MTSQDAKNDNETYLGRVLASKDHDYPFYFDGNNFVALTDFEVRLDEIRSNGDYHIIPTFVSLRNGHIASLESQLREKDREIDRYKLANKAYLASVDGALNEYLEKQKRFLDDIAEKDKEIERLKEDNYELKFVHVKNQELREALNWATGALQGYNYPEDFIEKCRKLIGE